MKGTFLRAAFEQEDTAPRAFWAELDGQAVSVPIDRLAPTSWISQGLRAGRIDRPDYYAVQ